MITSIHGAMAAAVMKRPVVALVTLATGSVKKVASAVTGFTKATFYGWKALSATAAATDNTSAVLWGVSDATGGSGGTAGDPVFLGSLAAGASVTITAPIGVKYDLADYHFLGATGDKVVVVYEQ